MTKSLASASSASEQSPDQLRAGSVVLGERCLHIWLSSRKQFVTSADFLRSVLSQYADSGPPQWQFTQGEHGKPALANVPMNLEFNLTHSDALLACAVTAGTPVGVDLEFCDARRDVMRLARRFFCPQEVAALEACDSATQRDRFYDYWTLKEAAVKCRGETLASGLDSRAFTLAFEPGEAAVSGRIAARSSGAADPASYCLLEPCPGFRLAICCLPAIRLPPQIELFEISQSGAATRRNRPLRASTWQG